MITNGPTRASQRRNFLGAAAMASLLCCSGALAQTSAVGTSPASANGYPKAGRVVIVVPLAPGGATDIIARLLVDELSRRWGVAVVVDNKAGAGGRIGTELAARAAPDGCTLLLGTQTALAVNPSRLKKVGYNDDKDFAPISLLAQTPLVLLASTKSGAHNLQELVVKIKASPDAVSYGTSGVGTSQHLTALMMLSQPGASAMHVPYEGSSQSLMDLAGKRIDIQFDNMATGLAFAKNGQVKALAVTTAARSPLAPELSTLSEAGLAGFVAATWLGLLPPAGTPAPVLSILNTEVVAVLNDPEVARRLAAQGFTPKPMGQETFARFIQTETAKFAQLIKSNKLVVE